jgi:hypothetical protein
MRRSALASLVALVLTGSVRAQTPASTKQGELVVTIKDVAGVVIPTAYVLVHPDRALRLSQELHDVSGESDRSGRFALKLDAGFYDVCVMLDSFSPDCRKELVQPDRTTERKVVLKLDPRILKIAADKF